MKRYIKLEKVLILIFTCFTLLANAQNPPANFQNPILPGFSPDPSICRVGDDYYLATSSFVWYPGIPVYHSKDLVNWKLVGHGITRPSQLDFSRLKDKNGIWAVTIRHHNGLFYLITTCNDCGGNFYITAKNPAGPWSDPVWLKDAPGIDPSLFWDDDGKCYCTGNTWNFKGTWPKQCAVWMQELDLNQKKLIGEQRMLTYGHAANATYTEAPHLYKIDGKYLLIIAEGGTDKYHSISAHHSNAVWGPYIADKINPVLSHRQLGDDYPIQAVGHGDLVQTQNGEWWATVLGKRVVNKEVPLSRETFLCRVKFEEGTPLFNPGYGKVLSEQERPNLPWSPVQPEADRDAFDSDSLALKWHFIRTPYKKFFSLKNGHLELATSPEVVDSLVNPAMIVQKIKHHQFSATTKVSFKTSGDNEQAGLIIYRTNDNYFTLMKDKSNILLIKKYNGKKELIAKVPYTKSEVYLKATANKLDIDFSFGDSIENLSKIGPTESLVVISESNLNKFNGPGIGVYASSNGKKSSNKAIFDWFEYKQH